MKKTLHLKRASRVALLVLLMSTMSMGRVVAHDFMVDGIYYNIINSSAKTVEVTNRDGDDHSYSGDVIIPSSVSYGGYIYSVIRIGNKAFNFCPSVTSIVIPNSVTRIGNLAFLGCSGLNVIDIPNSVETIGDQAFYNCNGLTTITIPESVKVVEGYAFGCCQNLSTVDFNAANCTQMGDSSPLGWREVFYECTSLTTLNIGENVRLIPGNAFDNCTGLSIINFNAIHCEVICAFTGCTNLNVLNYSEGVQYIDAREIRGLNKLSHISIPNTVTSIDFIVQLGPAGNNNSGFYGTGWYNDQPNGILILDGWCLGFKGETPTGNLDIQEGVRGIGNHALNSCPIETVCFPNTMRYIGDGAFQMCNNLNNDIVIPNNVLSIGRYAFGGCSKLGSVTLGSSLANVDDGAFCGCSKLNTIVSINPVPPDLGYDVFGGISSVATLFVPCGSQMAYFSSWSIFNYNNIHEDCTPRPVLVDSNVTGGIITPSVSEASMGQEVTFMVSPNPLMEMVSVAAYNTNNPSQLVPISTVDGTTVPTYKFNMPMFGVTLSATFEHASAYSISLSQGITGGSVSFSASEALAGETISLEIKPDPGYELRSLSVYNINNPSQTVSVTNNTFIMPSFDVMVSAVFVYTSVDESEINPISVYPNPTLGVVKIETESLRHISVFNEFGQQVYDEQAEGNEYEINLSGFESGVYLFRIETVDGVTTKRVVLTK